MNVWDFCIRRPVFTTVLMVSLVLFGVMGYLDMGVDLYPEIEPPIVSIQSTLVGANPEVMDQEVTDVIEEEVATLEGVDTIRSQSLEGYSMVIVEFDLSRDIDVAAQEVRDRVAAAARNLPQDMDPPLIQKVDPSANAIMWLTVMGEGPYRELSRVAEDVLKERLQSLPGVGGVQMGGFRRRAIRVWMDPVKMRALEVTPQDVLGGIKRRHVELPGGRIETSLQESTIKVEGEFADLDTFRTLIVAWRGGAPVRLLDLARIEDGQEDVRSAFRYNGKQAIGLGIRKQSGGNTVAVARAVKAALPELRKHVPDWITVDVAFDSSTFIEESVRGVEFDVVFGALFTGVVMYLFLRHLRSTVISVLAIPASLISTFGFAWLMDFTINQMTLLGLSLAVGLVIDDAIVVLENIYRHVEEGMPAQEAANSGTGEVAFAVVAATVSIAAIFLPVAFMGGIIGQFFRQFGLTIAVTILLSLVVSLTLTPMLSARMLHREEHETGFALVVGRWLDALDRFYRVLLGRVLATSGTRWAVLGMATLLFLASLGLTAGIGKAFASSQDQSRFMVFFEAPLGTAREVTEARMMQAQAILEQHPEIRGALGAVGLMAGEVHKGLFFINMHPRHERTISQQESMAALRRELNTVPGLVAFPAEMNPMSTGATRSSDIQYIFQGPDLKTLDRLANEVVERASRNPHLVDGDSDLDLTRPQVTIEMDRSTIADVGIDELQVTTAIQAMMGGINVAKYKSGGDRYDIRVKADDEFRQEIANLERIPLRTPSGGLVELGTVVDIHQGLGPNAVNRYNRQRSATVMFNVEGMPVGNATDLFVAEAKQVLARYPGYTMQPGGSTKTFQESMQYLLFALVSSIVIVYLVLAAQFESFLHPFTIMLTLPLAIVGVIVALFVTGKTLNIFSFIGIIMLVGIVTRNAILLVDYANQLRARGVDRVEAMLQAGPVRLRPILMTAVAAMVGIAPVALGMSEGGEARSPMGVAVIGGLLSSTFLTLLVIPAVYLTLEDVVGWVARRGRRQDRS